MEPTYKDPTDNRNSSTKGGQGWLCLGPPPSCPGSEGGGDAFGDVVGSGGEDADAEGEVEAAVGEVAEGVEVGVGLVVGGDEAVGRGVDADAAEGVALGEALVDEAGDGVVGGAGVFPDCGAGGVDDPVGGDDAVAGGDEEAVSVGVDVVEAGEDLELSGEAEVDEEVGVDGGHGAAQGHDGLVVVVEDVAAVVGGEQGPGGLADGWDGVLEDGEGGDGVVEVEGEAGEGVVGVGEDVGEAGGVVAGEGDFVADEGEKGVEVVAAFLVESVEVFGGEVLGWVLWGGASYGVELSAA